MGEKEAESGEVAVKSRGEDLGAKKLDVFIKEIEEEIDSKAR